VYFENGLRKLKHFNYSDKNVNKRNDSYFGAVHADWTCMGEPALACTSNLHKLNQNKNHSLNDAHLLHWLRDLIRILSRWLFPQYTTLTRKCFWFCHETTLTAVIFLLNYFLSGSGMLTIHDVRQTIRDVILLTIVYRGKHTRSVLIITTRPFPCFRTITS